MEKNSPITLCIDSSMEELWNQLGVDSQTRTDQINQIKAKCEEIYENGIKDLIIQCDKTKYEIEQLQRKHKQAMAAFGIPESEIITSFKPIEDKNLIGQLAAANKEYELFRIKVEEQVKKIENFVLICRDSFDALEIPNEERGEFAEVGESDFTRERIERFRNKAEELQNIINERKATVTTIKDKIQQIIKNMSDYKDEELEKLMIKDEVSSTYVNSLSECEKRANDEFESRLQQLKDYALDITNSWDTLNTPNEERNEFVKMYTDLSMVTLNACKEEILLLKQKESEILPQLVEGRRNELANLYSTLHISLESRPHFDKTLYEEKDLLHEEYKFVSDEIIRLKKLIETYHPILVEIDKRESIIEDYHYVLSIQKDPNRLTSRGPGMAQQLMKEEKARKRYKHTLPQVEENLKKLLEEYYKVNSKHFEWDGHPYIEKLQSNKKEKKNEINESVKAQSVKVKRVPLHISQNSNPNSKYMSYRN